MKWAIWETYILLYKSRSLCRYTPRAHRHTVLGSRGSTRFSSLYTGIRICCSGSAAPLLPLPLLSAVVVAGLAVEAVACSVSCLVVEVALQIGVASTVVAALVAGCSRDSSSRLRCAFSNTLYHRTGKCIVGAIDDRSILFQL